MNNKFLKNLIFTSIVASQDEPFTIYRTGTQSSTIINLNKVGSPVISGLYYRYGNSGNWVPLHFSSWGGASYNLTLNSTNGYEVQFYNTNDTFSTNSSNYLYFSFSGGNVGCKGNIQSLMNFSNECKPYCYYFLFRDCTSLTRAPELPATTLAQSCYNSMFQGCTSLTEALELPATTLASNCYMYMFYGCTSLIKAPYLPATTLVGGCYADMFEDCTSLIEAPELPATTLADYCYSYMFYGCTSLIKAPYLPATTLADYCYEYMFYNCTSLNYIKVGFTSWYPTATDNWVSYVSSSGSFESPHFLPIEYGEDRVPENWSIRVLSNIIIANDQQCSSMPNQEFSYTIQYMLYPETLKPTFKITSGTLPDGVTLDENTGVISGLVASEMTTNLQITLSCEGCKDKVINFTISIENAIWTENNLTSNTSNSAYEVSQRSTNRTAYAWRAMDGNVTSYSRTQYEEDEYDWWMIDFKSPVLLKAVELKSDNEGSYGTYLEGSNDNSTWTRLDTTTFPGDNTTTLRRYSLSTAYRYYRLICETSFYFIQFYEVRFKYILLD